MAKRDLVPIRWTLVQHSAYGYNEDPTFKRAVEESIIGYDANGRRTRAQLTKDQQAIERVGGLLFDDYKTASDAAEKINGVDGDRPFLHVKGRFSDKVQIDGLKVYIPPKSLE